MKAVLNHYAGALVLLLLGGMGIASCTNDKDPGLIESMPELIRFGASTGYMPRAGDITTNNLNKFNVYAYTGSATAPELFMNNVTVTKTSTNTWTYSPLVYWPVNEDVDFYAYAPTDWVGTGGPLKPVPYETEVLANKDIVYAACMNLRGNYNSPNAQVIFNFRHALSKVTIKMSSSNKDLKVVVSNVALANINSVANFNFPRATTSGTPTTENTGTWTDQNSPMTILYYMAQSPTDTITLTTTPTDMSTEGMGIGGGKYLIPQTLTWRANGLGPNDNFLVVMCAVYDADTGKLLWPNENTPKDNIPEGHILGHGLLRFPLGTSQFQEWLPGYHYIYNVVINANDEMTPIEFGNPTVDTYVDIVTSYQ